MRSCFGGCLGSILGILLVVVALAAAGWFAWDWASTQDWFGVVRQLVAEGVTAARAWWANR